MFFTLSLSLKFGVIRSLPDNNNTAVNTSRTLVQPVPLSGNRVGIEPVSSGERRLRFPKCSSIRKRYSLGMLLSLSPFSL